MPLKRLKEWIEYRWPVSAVRHLALDEEITGGPRYCYSFGSTLLVVFVLQAITGVMQLFYYVPTTENAYNSLSYLRTEVPFGWLIHGLHYWGAQLMVVLVLMHMARVFLWGAYKKPRELTWLVGTGLLLTVLAFSFTGAPLHWDLKGYWAGQVGTSIAGVLPVIGDRLTILLRGGESMGQLTITRFFGIHIGILPPLLLGLFALHIVAMRRMGSVGPWKEQMRATKGPFWPDQAFKDVIFGTTVLIIMLALVVFLPPGYTGPADPLDTTYVPKPEWDFLFLYQGLKYFQGPLEPVGAAGLPTVLVLILLLLPFVDRNPERNPLKRPVAMTFFMLLAGLIIALSIGGYLSKGFGQAATPAKKASASAGKTSGSADVSNSLVSVGEAAQPDPGGSASKGGKAGGGAPSSPGGQGEVAYISGDPERGAKLFERNCSPCHGHRGTDGIPNTGSSLGHVPHLNPIERDLYSPDPRVFSRTIHKFVENGARPPGPNPELSMPSFSGILSPQQIEDIIAYEMKLNGVTVTRAERARAAEEAAAAKAVPKQPPAEKKPEAARAAEEKAPEEEAAGPPLPNPASASVDARAVGSAARIIGGAKHGRALFDANCTRCHGEKGQHPIPNPGSTDGTVPHLDPIDPAIFNKDPLTFAENVDRFIQHGSVPDGPNPAIRMPNFGDSNSLTQQQISDLVAYVLHLNGINRAEIIHPGVRPRVFFMVTAGIYVLVILGLGGLWNRRAGQIK